MNVQDCGDLKVLKLEKDNDSGSSASGLKNAVACGLNAKQVPFLKLVIIKFWGFFFCFLLL